MNHLAAALALAPSGSFASLLRHAVRPRVKLVATPKPTTSSPAPTEAPIHRASGAIGPDRPLHLHCPSCAQGRAKRTPDGTYYCSPSRQGCGLRFSATGFEFDAALPRPAYGHWVLREWDPSQGKIGVWLYEVA